MCYGSGSPPDNEEGLKATLTNESQIKKNERGRSYASRVNLITVRKGRIQLSYFFENRFDSFKSAK